MTTAYTDRFVVSPYGASKFEVQDMLGSFAVETGLTRDQAEARAAKLNDCRRLDTPWLETDSSYQYLLGVHQPHIAEISGHQYARMSQRQQKQYNTKRHQEWDASACAKRAYRHHVEQSWVAGAFTLDQATPEAQRIVRQYQHALDEWDRKQAEAAKLRSNRDISTVTVGDRVFCIMGNYYGTVTKLNKRTVWFMPENPPAWLLDQHPNGIKTNLGCIQWLSYNDAKAS